MLETRRFCETINFIPKKLTCLSSINIVFLIYKSRKSDAFTNKIKYL